MGLEKGSLKFKRNRMTVRLTDNNFDYLCKRAREDCDSSLNSMLNTILSQVRKADGNTKLSTLLPDPKVAYVYVLEDDTIYFKIGWSSDPEQRRRDLESGTSQKLRIVLTIECELRQAPVVERILHQQFKHKRLKGEWFALTPTDIAWIRESEESLKNQARDISLTAKPCGTDSVN